jgi:hypothetical protein
MKKFTPILILPICFLLLSANPAGTHNRPGSKGDDFLVIRIRPDAPKLNERIVFTVNEFESGKTFFWNFGDGTDRVITTGCAASHTYSKPGTYCVSVHTHEGKYASDLVMISQ